jgi:hypothetical protein
MTWLGGQAGIQAGSAYAAAQSAAMGGSATGVIATVGGLSVGTLVAVPVSAVVVGAAMLYARMWGSHVGDGRILGNDKHEIGEKMFLWYSTATVKSLYMRSLLNSSAFSEPLQT